MERFPALGLIVKYGSAGSFFIAVSLVAIVIFVLWPLWGIVSLVVAVPVGGLVYLLSKSFVELVTILTEMLVPR